MKGYNLKQSETSCLTIYWSWTSRNHHEHFKLARPNTFFGFLRIQKGFDFVVVHACKSPHGCSHSLVVFLLGIVRIPSGEAYSEQ
jgi:hypothetical protein